MTASSLRNIAIIAHVDHGKTTLVDALLKQSGTLGRGEFRERLMDSNDLERERGITILAKNTAIQWGEHRINIVDTPGHADFGGEVERILSMVDSVLLLVDAVDGPMPQTRFVTQKAFSHGLNPIVVINKVDRPGARIDEVVTQVFDLFDSLGATDEQLDFPIVYASALEGYATLDMGQPSADLTPLFQAIVDKAPPAIGDPAGPLQFQISALDYSSYVGAIGIGRIRSGFLAPNLPVTVARADGTEVNAKVLQVLGYLGLARENVDRAEAGDIVAITGIEGLRISDTLCNVGQVKRMPLLTVDEPTITTIFAVNDSPFAGLDGKFVTSRQLKDRLERELIHNVALKVEETADPDKFQVSGRGELHLAILIENMRREGYELAVARPNVVTQVGPGGEKLEPYEELVLDVETRHQGDVMSEIGLRRGRLEDMAVGSDDRVRLTYEIPSRGLIGFHVLFLSLTSGSGLMFHRFNRFGAWLEGAFGQRHQGVLLANGPGKATAYSLFNIEPRGRLFIKPQTEVYEGMIIGLHSRDNDLVVNVTRAKQLTNIRAAGSDENIVLTPPIQHSLEQALAFINQDELLEVTPHYLRLRKKFLKENERKRQPG